MLQRKLTFYAFNSLLISVVLLNDFVPLVSVILLLIWLWEGDFSGKLKLLLQRNSLLLSVVCYFILAIAFVYIIPYSGWPKIEMQLTLVLLPILLFSLKSLNFSYHRRTFFKVYITSIYIAFLICIIRAVFGYINEKVLYISQIDEPVYGLKLFVGSMFSDFLAPPMYFTVLILVAFAVLIFDYRKLQSKRKRVLNLMSILILSLFFALLNID